MDRFQSMSVFVAVAEEQGFAAAARRLNMSPPAVTRSVASLEDHLGVKLLQRSTRYVRTTEAGLRYLDDARRILLELEAADATAAGINATPRGQLAITAPVLFGRLFVMPGVVEYLKQYPEVDVSVMLLDRVVNLLEEGIDVGVRIGKLPDSSMHALRVGSVRIVLCASPAYLKEFGTPRTVDDLYEHRMIASRAGNHLLDLRFKTKDREREVQIKTRLTTNTNDSAIEAALQGYGITRLISYQIAEYLKIGTLQAVLEDWEPDPMPVSILYREGRQAAAKVRTFVDFIAEQLREDPALN
ncbi:MAG: LysR family transcriptional regulator [Gammaproteobacteria bacterium]|jgi:DNA-binding transcriptional LysR family regulator|nr:LysR family transcriptional regulator [Gammaproteobacteria bacterium]